MALIELKFTTTSTGNMREGDREYEYEYEYNGYFFNTDTLRAVQQTQLFWEPSQYVPPADYIRPVDQPVHAECLADSYTKRTWFHDGNGGVSTQDEENATECGYTSPEEPEPPADCEASFAFTIAASRGPRFIMEFKDLEEKQHRVEWLEEGYDGEPEHIRAGAAPFRVSAPGTGNKVDVLSGSGATIELLVQRYGLLEEFYTTDERKFRVDHYVNEQLSWRGWNIPDMYSEPWVALPFHATVEAYDGIGGLENMPYLSRNGQRYYGRARSIDVIFRCLRLLDLDLPVWLAVNVWEDTMDLNVEPLSQSYADQSGYYNEDNEPLSCKEVLERILKPYNACIRQAGAALHLLRYDETKGPYKRRRATVGHGDTQVTFDEEVQEFEEVHLILRNGAVSYREKTQIMSSLPAYKRVTSKLEYGKYENLVLNGDFEQWSGQSPLFWTGPLPVGRVLEEKGEKFMLSFGLIRPWDVPRVERIANSANTRPLRSNLGYTFSFDYYLVIDDFFDEKVVEWPVQPELNLSGGTLAVTNPFHTLPRVVIDGQEYELPNGTVRTNIPFAQPLHRRVDLVYTRGGGYTYVMGTESRVADLLPELPQDAVVVTYITLDDKEARLGSVYWGTFHYAEIRPKVKIGAYYLEGRVQEQQASRNLPWVEQDKSLWVQLENKPESSNGLHTFKGTVTIHTLRLNTPGSLEVSFDAPMIYRDSIRGASFALDNIRFQERQLDGITKMLITGENEGHINTPPLEVVLHHGSGIPRTQALLTLADGSPAKTWNGGYLLQELTARSILGQHPRASQVLSATLTGPVSPISVLKDPFKPHSRFLVDRYVYDAKRALTEVTAIEVFGGAEELPPTNARLTEDGQPRVTEEFKFRIIEG